MALSTTYSIDDVIALPQGTTPWYNQFVDSMKHIKNTMDDVSSLSGGGAPGFGALIDTRWYLVDTSSSTTAYTAVTSPAATGSDSIPAGYMVLFDPASANTGACTLNIGSSEGAVSIKKDVGGSKQDLAADDMTDLTLVAFDGTDWLFVGGGSGGGGATGGGTDAVLYYNDQETTTDYTIESGQNCLTAGPIELNSTVTIPSGSVWVIV